MPHGNPSFRVPHLHLRTQRQGALGIIVNRPIDMDIATLFERVNVPSRPLPGIIHRACRCISAAGATDRGSCPSTGGHCNRRSLSGRHRPTSTRDILLEMALPAFFAIW